MITIYTEEISNRVEFIFNQICKHILGCQYVLLDDEQKYLKASTPSICYAKKYNGKGIHIVPHGLLSETGVRPIDPEVTYWDDLPIFFQTLGEDIPFDLFAASFFLLTRYEEYLEKEKDKHDRYPPEKSLAFRHGFLEQPIVDQWVMKLKKMLKEKYPELEFSVRRFQFIPTIDVDNVYVYRHKGPFINGYHIIKDILKGDAEKAKYRLSVILRLREDPYFNLKKITAIHQHCGTMPVFFFHCGCYGKYDKKTFIPSFRYRNARKNISRDFIVGMHPSYHAGYSPRIFQMERRAMERSTLDKKVFHSRFHYLRFRMPQSFQLLASEKIAHDWSMGYSSRPGFRAGTTFPYHFYNLKNEKAYRLLIHPFVVMDKTLKSDLGLNREEARQYMLNLIEKVRETNGVFVSVFHNENLTDAFSWRGWKKMYYSLLKEVSTMCLIDKNVGVETERE